MVTVDGLAVGAAFAGVVEPPLISTPMKPSRNKPPQTIDAFFNLDIFVVFLSFAGCKRYLGKHETLAAPECRVTT
jgi:hypothetical protein